MARNRNCIGLLLRVGVVICLAILISALASTGAAGFTVNSTADDDDMSCDPLSVGDCTLREAIRAVNDGLGKKIDFDPATFPPGDLTPIYIGVSPLPVIMESGTTVDGLGTGVVIDGNFLTPLEDGLVFESGTGTSLSKVTVRSIVVRNFPGYGIHVCGGARPNCNEPLSRITISHVMAIGNVGGDGIRIDGGEIDRTTVTRSYVRGSSQGGISIHADQNMNDVEVSDCTMASNDYDGIHISSSGNILKAKLIDNTASRNGGTGIKLYSAENTIKPKLTGNTSSGNWRGISVESVGNMVLPKLSDNHTAGNSNTGTYVNSDDNFLGGQFKDNVVMGNNGRGININGFSSLVKVKLQGNRSVNNFGHGIRLEGSSNIVKNNIVSDNRADGIRLDGTGQGNNIQGNRARGNDEYGIRIQINSTNAQIKGNEARGNGLTDLVDENSGCDANTWRGNTFVTINQNCID